MIQALAETYPEAQTSHTAYQAANSDSQIGMIVNPFNHLEFRYE